MSGDSGGDDGGGDGGDDGEGDGLGGVGDVRGGDEGGEGDAGGKGRNATLVDNITSYGHPSIAHGVTKKLSPPCSDGIIGDGGEGGIGGSKNPGGSASMKNCVYIMAPRVQQRSLIEAVYTLSQNTFSAALAATARRSRVPIGGGRGGGGLGGGLGGGSGGGRGAGGGGSVSLFS